MNMRLWVVITGVLTIGGSMGAILVSDSLEAMIVMRFFVGFGAGIGCLIAGANLPYFFEGKELATVMGIVTAGSGFWGFVFSNISGVINASFGWKASYMLFCYAVIPVLLFLIFIPKERFIQEPVKAVSGGKKAEELSPTIIFYVVLAFLVYMMVQVMWSNISIWIAEAPIRANLMQIGVAASVMPLASFIGRSLNGPIFNKLGRFTLHMFFVMLIAGLFIGSAASSFGPAMAAIFLVGATMGLAHPALTMMGINSSPRGQVRAQALILAAENLGSFFSTQWRVSISRLGDGSLPSAFKINACFVIAVLLVSLAVTFMLMAREKRRAAAQ